MDAHYSRVMEAREAIKESGKKLYFAYSGVLDRAAFEKWREQHSYQFFDLPKGEVTKALDVRLVFDFPSRWWGGRVAGLEDHPGGEIYGLLFEIPAKDWPVVQHKEGVISGMAIEKTIRVQMGDKILTATTFVTAPHRSSTDGDISQAYLDALQRGARASGLPEDYVEGLAKAAK